MRDKGHRRHRGADPQGDSKGADSAYVAAR